MRRRRNALTPLLLVCVAVASASIAGVAGTRGGSSGGAAAVLLPLAAAPVHGETAPGTGRIINGTRAAPLAEGSRWRSISLVVYYDVDARRFWSCGGTFVTARHLVTAAHCTYGSGPVPARHLFVTSGIANVADVMAAVRGGRRPAEVPGLVPVRTSTIHPGYVDSTTANDVAVLEASRDATLSPTLLVGAREQGAWGGGHGRPLDGDAGPAIAGWGNTAFSGAPRMSEDLLEARIPILSDSRCVDSVGTRFTAVNMVCGGVLDTDGVASTTNGVDACQGDSGGPLLAPVADGSMRLVGITSWGYGCAGSYPGVYTRVDAVRAWIEGITGAASGTTEMPATAPAPVAGGGAAGAASDQFRLTAPAMNASIPSTGSTTVKWLLPPAARATEVTIEQAGRTYATIRVAADATSVVVPNHRFVRGSSYLCAVGTVEDQVANSCVNVTKGTQFSAGISSAVLRNGKLTLRGRVAASTRTVRVHVKARAGRRTVTTTPRSYRVPAYPRSRSFAVTVPWTGAAPARLTTTTVVAGGGDRRAFRSTLR